jgi:membrane-associated protease RseP (regulator of RpoE activity)
VLHELNVLVDTGGVSDVTFSREHIELLERSGNVKKVRKLSVRVDGFGNRVETNEQYILREMKIAEVTFWDVPVDAADVESVGMSVLRYFNFTLDFASDLALFEPVPADRREIRPAISAAGFIPAAYGADPARPITVDIVEADSPASRAGLVHGDIIHQIDGQPVAGMSWWDRIDVFAEVGRTRRLTVERDGKELLLDLKLAHNFSWPIEWPPEKPEFSPEPCGGP